MSDQAAVPTWTFLTCFSKSMRRLWEALRYLILLARGLRIIMLICRLGWMLLTVGLIVRDMSGQELDLFGRLGNGFLQKKKSKIVTWRIGRLRRHADTKRRRPWRGLRSKFCRSRPIIEKLCQWGACQWWGCWQAAAGDS